MTERKFHSLAEQVTEVLKEGMLSGRWRETLPEHNRLAGELGVRIPFDRDSRQLTTSTTAIMFIGRV